MHKRKKVGILLFNEVDVLDFTGPFEVFSLPSHCKERLFEVKTISEFGGIISARNGLKVMTDFSFKDNYSFDIVIVPGGQGAEEIEIKNPNVIKWIKNQSKVVEIIASVCTGAFLLAESGILQDKKATTHWMYLDRLKISYPRVKVAKNAKFVDEGNILTSGGISNGIDMSLHIVERLFGALAAFETSSRMEYAFSLNTTK